ncbi:hypothetical protein LOD99_12914 [Oopsacas minuta]|uniref:3CxxC-type domain-containing protein n=1 Tax=Oopsacas minuta TaxID=111878 RepID=A0AAV7JAK5_9METZ|nr:hypothetical protein LOD99_12914 [Oopsacas minuta]
METIRNCEGDICTPILISLDIDLDPGDHKMTGYFCCPCGRKWNSANSYQNKKQKCSRCSSAVLPTRLVPGRRCEVADNGRHQRNLCEMCYVMGRDCSKGDRFTQTDLDNFCNELSNN